MKRYLIVFSILVLIGLIAALLHSGFILRSLGTTDGDTSGIRGVVLLGPTCPVERDPPDPKCADKPYSTTISVYRTGSSEIVETTQSDASGAFQFSLPPGNYTLQADGGAVLPRCASVDTVVEPDSYVTTNIPCDTGIR